jgi:plastocyanin
MFRSTRLASAILLGLCTASFAQISGKVTLQGTPPEMKQIKAMSAIPQCAQLHKDPVYEDTVVVGEKGELANVIVFIKEEKPGDLRGPQNDKPATLDQKNCMYVPHVLAVQIGQPVILVSSDPFLHNARSEAVANKPFNIPQFTVAANVLRPFTAEETFQIKCDVHPWMRAVVRVFDHPYFATSSEDGKFTIKANGLKDGTYTLVAWHEVYKDSEPQAFEIKDGKAVKEVDFTFKAAASN